MVAHGSPDALRRQRPSTPGEEEAVAEGARGQGRDLRLLRLDARARPALAAARDDREDGEGPRRPACRAPRRRQVAGAFGLFTAAARPHPLTSLIVQDAAAWPAVTVRASARRGATPP